jgi:rfaE bifunctional protein kinase chain/domain/rfaE bifunctional protein nucleotidyltransferase chain/domain
MKDYLKKIVSTEQLLKKIGKFPRNSTEKVAMCHGVFDLVHPGHIRHLVFAKEKVSKLIVSITSDIHVKKAELRPYVPQALRAENLAALEFVDFVIIDENETPIKNLKKIKPDFFVKGYEYVKNEKNPRTNEEMQVLKSYGAQFLFTPGDFILSSSKIIESDQPDLSIIKLKSLMEGENVTFNDLRKTLADFKNCEVLVVGDTIIDNYVNTSIIGNNAKTPTFSTKYIDEENFIGGAAIIALHLRAAGVKVKFCSVIGNDLLGSFVKKELKKNKISDLTIVDNVRPTTEKKYFISGANRLLKVDKVENSPISDLLQEHVTKVIKGHKKGIVIFSDFRHGIFNHKSIPLFIKAINKGIYKVADSQVASRWGNILDFKNFDLITPNEKELRFSLADQDTAIRPLASLLFEKARCKVLMLKLGEKGLMTVRRSLSKNDMRSFFVMDAFEKNAVDPVGCGDALISYASISLYISKNPLIASILGSISAGLLSLTNGNVPILKNNVEKKLTELENALNSIA